MKTPAITLASLEARPECFCFPPPRNRKLQSPSGEESGYSGVPGLESPKGVSADRSGYKSDPLLVSPLTSAPAPRPLPGPGRRPPGPSAAPRSRGGHGRAQAGGMGPGRGQPLRRAASNKNRTTEHTYQSQYRTQQGMSYQYFQIQIFFGYKRPHYYLKEC